MNQERL